MTRDRFTPMAELDALIAMMPPEKPEFTARGKSVEAERIRLAKLHAEHRGARLASMKQRHSQNRDRHIAAMRERRRKAKGVAV